MKWQRYTELEPIRRLRNEGRELLGKHVVLTEKRDGENVSIWLNGEGEVSISSHNMENAGEDIVSRFKATAEYPKIADLIITEANNYKHDFIAYGELLKTVSPTRIEPRRKHPHWILFDIWDGCEGRYIPYNRLHQYAYGYKIPIVRIVHEFAPASLDEVTTAVDKSLKWCKHHRREGVVGKHYDGEQILFKEKIDLPERPRIEKPNPTGVQYPPMPEENILRALQHAFDAIGEGDWMNKAKAMPIVARYISVEAREHDYSPPRDIYRWYVNTPLDEICVRKQ